MTKFKRTAAFTFSATLLATMAFAGTATAAKDNQCGSSNAKVGWGISSTNSIDSYVGDVIGNPAREAGAFYCTLIRTNDAVMIVGAEFDLGL